MSVTFLLGGAYGVSDDVKAKAQKKIALSAMTFTHEMSRLILLEQLYRSFTILQKKGYHH
jgi:23S rRNA (pseudouridine1915-N3)-methyltransferase